MLFSSNSDGGLYLHVILIDTFVLNATLTDPLCTE
jgi:hypothetical protein